MEAIILAGGKAERLGDAAGGRPKALVEVGGPPARRLPGRAARPGRGRAGDHLVRRRPGRGVRARARRARPRGRRRRGARAARARRRDPLRRRARARERGDVYALNGDELVAVDFAALLARHREAGGAATVAVARPRSPFGVVDLGEGDAVEGFSEAGADPLLGQLRHLRPLARRRSSAFPERGDHETTTLPGARRRAAALRLPPRGALADGEHAQGAARRRRPPRRAPGVAARERSGVTRAAELRPARPVGAFEPRRVEKPWGHELIWALSDATAASCCSSRRASRSRSSTTARRTSRGSSSRAARGSSSAPSATSRSPRRSSAPGAAFRYRPGTVHRITALEDTTILEVSTPQLDDVVRLEDGYGREGTSDA